MNSARLIHRYLVAQRMPFWAVGYYDRLIDAVTDEYLQPLCEAITRAFPDGARIVDAGTGTGQLPVRLTRACPGCRVTGVDLSEGCLRAARAKAEAAGVADRVVFLRANLEATGLPAASADLVVSACSLHHWRRPARVLSELARLLRPGGEIWLWDDAAEARDEERAAWTALVERQARAGLLFRFVFGFESRHLAYSREELAELGAVAGLRLSAFELRGVFFLARLAPTRKA
jgi:ubiquinone/menaquinone biosynthesis C-methylase UbiE